MAEKIIAESDLNEKKVKRAATPAPQTMGEQTSTNTPDQSSPMFEAAGIVSPSPATEGAAMPGDDSRPEKRGRGRPKGGTNTKRSHKKKPATEAEGEASAQLIVGMLDILKRGISAGECPDNPEMRVATVGAWREYLAENGWEVPAWVQVTVISIAYTAPAFSTPKGQSRMSGAWAKVKGWWIARKG